MAVFEYKGKGYFYACGRWVDHKSQVVSNEIASELDKLYPQEVVRKKNAVPKKQVKNTSVTNNYGKGKYNSLMMLVNKGNCGTHKKARTIYDKEIVELTTDQKRALAILESGQNVFLSGEAGTGKSFVLNEFINRNRSKNVIVCAPTGIAAINVSGSTLHRVFGAPISVIRPGEYNAKPNEAIIKADIIIIDEISMCRLDLFEYVIRTIKYAESIRQYNTDEEYMTKGKEYKLYAAKQIIVVGDFYQLAPVISDKQREILFQYWDEKVFGAGFAFYSRLWTEMNFKNIVLKEIVRQKGEKDYVQNLNKIRMGDASGISWFNENVSKEVIPGGIYLCGTNSVADSKNKQESDALKGAYKEYTAEVKGQVKDTDKLTSDILGLKMDMQVMTLVNDSEEGYQNGSIGKIVGLYDNHVAVRLNTGRLINVVPYEWEICGYEIQQDKVERVVLGNFKQLPLKIAYAITIHKSQGQTYSIVNISPNCFAEGQLYVALSRAKSIEGMSLEYSIPRQSLRTSKEVKHFYENLKEAD